MGLDYKTLSKLKPSIVCVHLSAYGRDNERASWPGYDYLMQAEAGLMHLTGEPDGPPTRIGAPSMIDHTTGLTAMVGLLVRADPGARHRQGLRRGHVPLRRGAAPARLHRHLVPERGPRARAPDAQRALLGGAGADVPDRRRLDLRDVPDRQVLERAARRARSAPTSTPMRASRPQAARQDNREALTETLDAEFRKQPTAHWLDGAGGRAAGRAGATTWSRRSRTRSCAPTA